MPEASEETQEHQASRASEASDKTQEPEVSEGAVERQPNAPQTLSPVAATNEACVWEGRRGWGFGCVCVCVCVCV